MNLVFLDHKVLKVRKVKKENLDKVSRCLVLQTLSHNYLLLMTTSLQFWLTDDTNTLYYSDGTQWSDLGSPIQGPPGTDGADGADGSNGLNGAPGKGWYDTQIIDQRPSNYQITFLSNDGLQFTTDNIMGPQGEAGTLQVATKDTLGGIKIGRGLDIAPDGTASAGQTSVNLGDYSCV